MLIYLLIIKIKVDVQYSQNFACYGDLRLDFISAYSKGLKGIGSSNIDIFKEFEKFYGLKVDKVGKYFQQDYLDAVMVLFYDYKFQQNQPDKMMIIGKQELLNYLSENIEKCFKNLKLNNKKDLGDTHGSAFLPIKVTDLKSRTNCFFGTIDNLKKVKDEIKIYLN